MIVVSSCLAGIHCKYNGENNEIKAIVELIKAQKAICVCPEILGGLTCPRLACEIWNDIVVDIEGNDHTQSFQQGAKLALKIALENNCKKAILKAKSPSCGVNGIYDGTFSHTLVKKNGITAQLFLDYGIQVVTEDEFVASLIENPT